MYRLGSSMTDRICFDEHVAQYAREAFAALAATGESLELTDEMLESHRESFLDGLAVDDTQEAIARFDDAFRRTWAEELQDHIEFAVYEDNAGGIYLFVFGADSIEYSVEYTGTPTGQLAQDLAELRKTGTTADWDHEFCLDDPERTLDTLERWVKEGTGGAKLIADQDGVYLEHAGAAGRLALGDEMYTVAEAAEALELSEPRIRTLCQDGRMGRKVGRDWVIKADEIEAMRDRPGPGRPRKMAE